MLGLSQHIIYLVIWVADLTSEVTDLLHYVVDLMLKVADLNLKVPDLRSGEVRLTLTPVGRLVVFQTISVSVLGFFSCSQETWSTQPFIPPGLVNGYIPTYLNVF